jgi:hypothetical protein
MAVVEDDLCELERDLADLKADLMVDHASNPKAVAFVEWIEQGEQHIREWKAVQGAAAK